MLAMMIDGIGYAGNVPLSTIYFHDNASHSTATLCLGANSKGFILYCCFRAARLFNFELLSYYI